MSSAVPKAPGRVDNADNHSVDWTQLWKNVLAVPNAIRRHPLTTTLPSSFPNPDFQPLLSSPTPHQQRQKATKQKPKHYCIYPACDYFARLPKDVQKHNLTHYPPTIKCLDKGCNKRYRRSDHCARHAKELYPYCLSLLYSLERAIDCYLYYVSLR